MLLPSFVILPTVLSVVYTFSGESAIGNAYRAYFSIALLLCADETVDEAGICMFQPFKRQNILCLLRELKP